MIRVITGLGWYALGGAALVAGWTYIAVTKVKDALRPGEREQP